MGLFKHKPATPTGDPKNPKDALRLAQEALAKTGTYVDEHGRRRKITDEQRADMSRGLDSAQRELDKGRGEPER